jgi:hypothetical protein
LRATRAHTVGEAGAVALTRLTTAAPARTDARDRLPWRAPGRTAAAGPRGDLACDALDRALARYYVFLRSTTRSQRCGTLVRRAQVCCAR